MIKKLILLLPIFVFINTSCAESFKIDSTSMDKAEISTYTDFFNHMSSNKYLEKIAKKNYVIFNVKDENFVYYGKIDPGFSTFKVREIYKVNKKELREIFPLYRKLNGYDLTEIVENDYVKIKNLESKSVRLVKSNYTLVNRKIHAKIDFSIKNNKELTNQEVNYQLDCKDFSILKRE